VKRLLTGCKWISYMDVHPTGDHVLLGSLDRRVAWFDMDLASTPYKTLRYHTKAIRCALFHRQVCKYYTYDTNYY
jgi:ribosome biogenesis protein ERB1